MTVMDVNRVMELLPHRYPFLLIDKVTECEPGNKIVAYKNVTVNEPFFQGHFPQKPVMPGVLIIEAMAQATCILALESEQVSNSAIFLLVGVDKARFKRQVEPGDQLVLEMEFVKRRRDLWVFTGSAKVDGKVAASAEIMCTAREL